MPILLIIILPAVFTFGIFFLEIYLLRQWWIYKDTIYLEHARYCLYSAIILFILSAFGRFVVRYLFSKRKHTEHDPVEEESVICETLRRPDGTKLNIQIFGDKENPPLIFIHGWNATQAEWYYERKYFSQKYRVILYDLPGLGKSTEPKDNDYSLKKMAADLEAVIEHFKLSNIVLWGHSMGGMIILTYCSELKQKLAGKIKGIILQHTTFTDPTKTSLLHTILSKIKKPVLYPICYIMIALWPLIWLIKWMGYFNGSLLIFTRFLFFTGTQTGGQLDFIARLSAKASPAVFAKGMLGMMKTYDVSNKLSGLQIPTLIFSGKHDRLTRPFASKFMHERIPNSLIYTIQNGGHQGLVENHEITNTIAENFIQNLSPRQEIKSSKI